jgi:DNA helicase-2/ATP-dependent DNA helicase PcrA
LHLIAERGCSIIAAGDDDQSIYSFRYAAPEGIRRFPEDYPGCSIYPLSVTQRCGRRIIEWATHVIAGDPDRPRDRPALRCADGSPDGEVALLVFPGEITEAQGIAALIQQLIDRDQVPAEEILVLLRGDHNGTFSGPVKRALDDLGIAYSDPDAVERMLAEPDNRRMLATFRLLVHERDSLAWASLLLLTPGIGQTFCDYIYERARVARVQFGEALFAAYEANFPDAPRSAKRAQTLMQVVTAWLTAHPAPDEMPEEGWGHWMVGTAGDVVVPEPSTACIELLHALDGLMEESPLAVDAPDYLSGYDAREGFEDVRPGDIRRQGLDRFMSQITPLGKDRALAESHGVRIMTMVGSKGLTVRAAIIAGLDDGIVPRPDADLGEERRLLYVAMTRAKEFLFGTWAGQRRGPTARAGRARVRLRRQHCHFFVGGAVQSQDGATYLRNR